MDLQDRFRKLINLKQEHERIVARQKEERIAEEKRVREMFTPRIEKVCKAFSKALGWEYSRTYSGGGSHQYEGSSPFTLTSPSYGERTLYIQVDINLWEEHDYWGLGGEHLDDMSDRQIPARTVVVSGDSNNSTTVCSLRAIPFDKFTEEKLAEAFEHSYKRLITYCILPMT